MNNHLTRASSSSSISQLKSSSSSAALNCLCKSTLLVPALFLLPTASPLLSSLLPISSISSHSRSSSARDLLETTETSLSLGDSTSSPFPSTTFSSNLSLSLHDLPLSPSPFPTTAFSSNSTLSLHD
ncbi:hypothetical protein NC653_021930 [Populus alba x Populus x berolinensis]|uniref:Uncharacterized protein n=1 Tax=Populus alba x Populus x berolinensis TaxID=444605 RepID=A0AAD6VTJ3_9ROSI|nr:hypothetical protein NC653_021930 [Populus alba x Populus x berolinensis]